MANATGYNKGRNELEMIRVLIICILLEGCAVALPLAGAGGTIRSEYKYNAMRNDIETLREGLNEANAILNYLIERELNYEGKESN
jgi:isocitrate lyase